MSQSRPIFKRFQLNNIYRDLNNITYNKENTRIFIIRHGNAFHNKPLKLTGPLINRNVDTNLTPLGIYQARLLGEELKKTYKDDNNIFCASYLNRSQHTALELVKTFYEEDNNEKYQDLINLENFFTKFAIKRLLRTINKGILFRKMNKGNVIKKLTNPDDLKLSKLENKNNIKTILENIINEGNIDINNSCQSAGKPKTK